MLIAFNFDIHGNLPPFEAAIADAEDRWVQRDFAQGNGTRFFP